MNFQICILYCHNTLGCHYATPTLNCSYFVHLTSRLVTSLEYERAFIHFSNRCAGIIFFVISDKKWTKYEQFSGIVCNMHFIVKSGHMTKFLFSLYISNLASVFVPLILQFLNVSLKYSSVCTQAVYNYLDYLHTATEIWFFCVTVS